MPERPEGLDWYEQGVLELLRALYPDGRVPLAEKPKPRRDPALRKLARRLFYGEDLRKLAEEAVERYPPYFGALLLVHIALAIPVNFAISKLLPLHDNLLNLRALLTNLLAAGANIAILAMPSHVLGRWKPGYLERYAAWQAFREASRARPPLDQKALAYLVALGLADEVKRALALDPSPLAKSLWQLVEGATRLASTTAAASGAGSGSRGGGGGGGGAGAR